MRRLSYEHNKNQKELWCKIHSFILRFLRMIPIISQKKAIPTYFWDDDAH